MECSCVVVVVVSICLSVYLSIHPSIYLSIHLSIHLSIYLSFYLSISLSIFLSIYLSIHLSIYLLIYLSLGLCVCLSIYLSICKLENRTILRDFFIFQSWRHQKRSNSAWLPHFSKLTTSKTKQSNSARLLHFSMLTTSKTKQFARLPQFLLLRTSKTKQFCETSSIFKLDNIKNEAILRDFLQKWKVKCSADGLVPMRCAIFTLHLSKVLRLPQKIDARSCEVLHLSRKIILGNRHIWCSKMQPLSGNQRPDLLTSLMDMSLVLRLPGEMIFADPLQMSHACHRFWKCHKTLTFCSLLTRCTIPCACHAKRDLNIQKWSETLVFLTFWLGNVLRATTACTFSTSQVPKVVRPHLVCFVHFDLEMCFAPQRRALFRHLKCQKWSAPGVLCAFWLGNVLRASTACTFQHLNFQKWSECGVFCTSWLGNRTWCVLYILTWKCASLHNGVQFFISPLASCLRTRRFSEPTFRPSGATNHWKNTVFRDFPTFSHLFAHLHLLSSYSFSSTLLSSNLSLSLCLCPTLLFICPYRRKFDF